MIDIKKDFPLLNEKTVNGKKTSYLDSAATTQKPIQVLDAIDAFYKKYNANPHRGTYQLSQEATEQYEQAREKIAKFINAPSKEQIIFTKNASESLNLLAYSYGMDNIKEGDEIVVKCIGWDKKGRLNFSRKKVFQNDDKQDKEKEPKKETKEEVVEEVKED